jgi:hypothetical protein
MPHCSVMPVIERREDAAWRRFTQTLLQVAFRSSIRIEFLRLKLSKKDDFQSVLQGM